MSILTPRLVYAPFEYDQAYTYWELQQQSHWLHSEISMSSDINDWKTVLTPQEKNVIGNILKGFTQSEVVIGEYWGSFVSKKFRKPEIQLMSGAFSSMEGIHQVAYAYLNQSLDLEDFSAFLQEPTAKAKIDRLISTRAKTKEEIAKSLAVFSAFNEGVSLFSSFAILLNFSRFNKMKGLGQIIAFSIKDECYSEDTSILTPSGWKLFKDLTSEDMVAQFDPKTKEVTFVKPSRIVSHEIDDTVIEYGGDKLAYRSKVTKGHRVLWRNSDNYKYGNKEYTFTVAKEFNPNQHKIAPVSGYKVTGQSKLTPKERFCIAMQADGFISERYTGSRVGTRPVEFSFAKQRKIKRFREILSLVGYEYSEWEEPKRGNKNKKTCFKVNVPITDVISKEFKTWVNLEEKSSDWCKEFILELSNWDGNIPKKGSGNYTYYSTVNPENAEIVQAIASLCGKWATKSIQIDNRKETFSDIHRVYIHDMDEKRLGSTTKTEVNYKGKVWCVTVPTGAVIVKYKDSVVVSGNCLHSTAGCWLFNTLVSEFPEIMSEEFKEDLYDAARLTVQLEDDFIDKVFELGDIEGITSKDVKNFIRHRTNLKLQEIGLTTLYRNLDKDALSRMEWFDVLSGGVSMQDFFSGRVTDYSKGNMDWNSIWENSHES